jgi:hypothetical protein
MEKVKVVRRPGTVIMSGCLWWIMSVGFWIIIVGFLVTCYATFVVWMGIVKPYQDLTDFILRAQMQPGASCTITSAQIYSYTESDDNGGTTTYYDPEIGFTLRTPGGRDYNTTEHDAPSFTSSNDAQAYLSRYQVHHVYSCWYDRTDPTVAMFVNLGFGDIAGLVGWFFVFLFGGVLPNALLIWALCRVFVRRRRERRA